MIKYIIILLLILKVVSASSQDSIIGIYCNYSFDIAGEFDVFYNKNKFVKTVKYWNLGQPIYGTWERINDSTIYVHLDSTYNNDIEELYYRQSGDTILLQVHKIQYKYRKKAGFYLNDNLKYEIKKYGDYECKTTYYTNGKVNEIIEFRKKKQHGIYFKFNERGILITQEWWKKGKKQNRRFKYYNDGQVDWQKSRS